jgi:diguanylate cyclase (GGDEF)-like protein
MVDAGHNKKNTILIVDDDVINLKALIHILSPSYTVYTAKDGQDAIDKACAYLPDLILLDIILPQMDGFAIMTKLKKMEETKNIPVIFISGLSSTEDEERGLLYEAADYITKPFSESIVKLRVRNQMQTLNNLRNIEQLSMMDTLTNIPNRRSFNHRINLEWGRAIRDKTPMSVLLMDIDKFKVYNDTYGHQQGDVVLQTVAGIFKHALKRTSDFAARWGGEEFVILLPDTNAEGALIIAESIRKTMEDCEIPLSCGGITKVTISIGVNTKTPTGDDMVEEYFAEADMALYTAKDEGRNRVVLYNAN